MNRLIRVLGMTLAVVLTAKMGRIVYQGHTETWYNLKMNKVVERADNFYGLSDVYGVTEDGIKTYNGFVIVAADWNVHPFGSTVETSRGLGLVLDHHNTESETIDIATSWGKGGKK